jgi:hypothetical protein
MKKLLTILALITISIPTFASPSIRNFLFPTYTTKNGTTIVQDRLKWIYIIKPNKRKLIFSSTGSTAKALASQYPDGTVLINAGYFWRDNRGYFPAGHYALDPAPVDTTHCERDPNLCGYLFTETLTIAEKLAFTKEPVIAAGPIMMLDGVVNKEIQQPRSHRQRKTFRTLLIQTKTWPFFLVTKKQFALDRLLAYTVRTFGRSISVINLDGWSSTTLRTDNPAFQTNIHKRLPTFFVLQ